MRVKKAGEMEKAHDQICSRRRHHNLVQDGLGLVRVISIIRFKIQTGLPVMSAPSSTSLSASESWKLSS